MTDPTEAVARAIKLCGVCDGEGAVCDAPGEDGCSMPCPVCFGTGYDVTAAVTVIERLRSALKPFADCCEQIAADESDEEWAKFRLLIKDYRAARAAIDPASVGVKP